MEVTRRKCVILVTGASGFLGHHVVSALAKYADHVTEIRTFDMVKYDNKTDFPITKETRHIEGDILDKTLLTQACVGVHGVIHLANIIDLRIRPNADRSHLINVEGTRTVLEVCREVGVKRFVYCSSTAVAVGFERVSMGTEDSLPTPPLRFLSTVYGKSKYEAERLVLEANCKEFHTVSLRPSILYGEYNREIDRRVRRGRFQNTYVPELYDATGRNWVYAGNAAWAFIRAEISLHECDGHGNQSVAGEAFFITDHTPMIPNTVHHSLLEICFEDAGLKPVIPLAMFRLFNFCCQLCLFCLFWMQVNMFKTKVIIDLWKLKPFTRKPFTVSSEKAKSLLNYEPMFSYKEAKKRTTGYIHSLVS